MWKKLKRWSGVARAGITLHALWKLTRHPATPRAAKWLALAVLAYAASPIDLIPDFIPVLGMLDELILIPAGVALVLRWVPPALWQQCLLEAEAAKESAKPRLWWGAALIVAVWALLLWGAWSVFAAKPLL